jgi:hypothetical protein
MRRFSLISYEANIRVQPKLAGPVIPVQHDPEGWQNVQRRWRTSFTEWQGAPSWELQIPFIFDQMHFNPRTGSNMNPVERECRLLERLAEKMPHKPRTPILRVDAGGLIPHDYTSDHTKQWICATITWGDYIINTSQDRTRQEGNITLWEYVPDQILVAKERLPARPVPKTYRIKKGDTLQKIAAYFYGDQAQWHAIAKLNKIRDPHKLKLHRVIKLPTVTWKSPTLV